MKKHSGMRPHDIVVLLKIVAKGEQPWLMKDLAHELSISAGEISESLNRSMIAGLIASDKKRLMRSALFEFLVYGLKYTFPQRPGSIVRGLPTAHSAPPLNAYFHGGNAYVWPSVNGKQKGQSIEPLHPNVAESCTKDSELYELLALCDALRVGKVREQNLAKQELEKRICYQPTT